MKKGLNFQVNEFSVGEEGAEPCKIFYLETSIHYFGAMC